MTPAPEDLHHSRVDDRAFEVVARVIAFLEAGEYEYVLAGGWAAYAYGTRVPSADTDVFLPDADAGRVYDLVENELGVTTGRGGRFEVLSLDQFNRILGPDPELGEPDRGFLPRKLLSGHVVRLPLDVLESPLHANVPEAREFTFTKLKALHDRELASRAVRDPAVMATIPPMDRGEIREKIESYYAAKAGKDLFDVAHMFAHHVSTDAVLTLADEYDLRSDLEAPLFRPDPYIRGVAVGLAADPSTKQWIEQNCS